MAGKCLPVSGRCCFDRPASLAAGQTLAAGRQEKEEEEANNCCWAPGMKPKIELRNWQIRLKWQQVGLSSCRWVSRKKQQLMIASIRTMKIVVGEQLRSCRQILVQHWLKDKR